MARLGLLRLLGLLASAAENYAASAATHGFIPPGIDDGLQLTGGGRDVARDIERLLPSGRNWSLELLETHLSRF